MELPVENRNYAIRRVLKISGLVLVIIFIALINYFSLNTLYLSITIAAIDLILSFVFISRHTIERVRLIENKFKILYKGTTIMIEPNTIEAIHSGFNDFIVRFGEFSIMYRFDLNQKFRFGDKLYFKYPAKNKLDEEPEEMKIIKRIIKSQKTEVN